MNLRQKQRICDDFVKMQGVKEKILDGFEFKKHIDTAAELNPSDHITHHLLGRFCFEVSQVGAKYSVDN